MYISSKFKCQFIFNWHLNLIEVCATQSWTLNECLMYGECRAPLAHKRQLAAVPNEEYY